MLSFFGDGPTPSKSTVTVARVASKKVPPPNSAAKLASSAPRKPLIVHASSAALIGSRPPKPNPHSSSATPNGLKRKLDSPSAGPSARVKIRDGSNSATPASDRGAKGKAPVRNRTEEPTRVMSESDSDSGSDAGSSSDIGKEALRRRLKRKHTTTAPIDRAEEMLGRKPMRLFSEEEGRRAWEGFVTSDTALRGIKQPLMGAAALPGITEGKSLDKYVAFFPQLGFEKEALPSVELQYPAPGCTERFSLLNPTVAGEFQPISELRDCIKIILDLYIPPSHRHIFGSLSDNFEDHPSRLHSPAPHLPSPTPEGTPGPALNGTDGTIADAIRRALSRNRRDGPGFVKAVERFNNALRDIQADGTLGMWMEERDLRKREWGRLVEVVNEQAYARVVGPYSNELAHHPKHSDEVARAISAKEDSYGELRHAFMSKIIDQTNLGPDSLFVDLGSGVGNCVVQAALQAGCKSYGFELLPVPSHCARLQVEEIKRRWAMWGLLGNPELEVHECDFRFNPEVTKRLQKADVVLVNNEVFPSVLNQDLEHMFLDLKEGATIVSLKPFVPDSFRMTEANCDSFAAILRSTTHTYARDWVSWKGDSGTYFVQVIDHKPRIKFEEEMKRGRRG